VEVRRGERVRQVRRHHRRGVGWGRVGWALVKSDVKCMNIGDGVVVGYAYRGVDSGFERIDHVSRLFAYYIFRAFTWNK
jgi:hypothetical protein